MRIFASPLARKLARDNGLELAAVSGSGPSGRIVAQDIRAALAQRESASAGVSAAIDTSMVTPREEVPLSGMRKAIAKRLQESKQTIPHFYCSVDIQIDKLLAVRKDFNTNNEGEKTTINDFIIRSAALALTDVPAVNVQYGGDKLIKFERADVSVAVAVDEGLMTPVIRGAEHKGVREISREMRDMVSKARAGKLLPEDYQGGTFTVSNIGMYGIKKAEAVINPPQAAILAVGQGEPRAIVQDGAVTVATVMTVTLSCDHRVIDGAIAAAFLKAIKERIETPSMIMA